MNILVLGYFGYETNQLDGQTIKTRDVYSLLKEKSKFKVSFFDTQSFQHSKINIIKMAVKVLKADTIFYLPAHNNLKYIFPIIFIISKISSTKINYIVVGGWLGEFLKSKPLHRFLLKRINGVYTETNDLYLKLKKLDFNNIYHFHNFRLGDFKKIDIPKINSINLKLVFMARVHPLKGVDLLFQLKDTLEESGLRDISIDIYGPIYAPYREDFFKKLSYSKINYCGVLQPEEIPSFISKYDLMLFPTKFYTEGFPGTILDAYISGVPVVCTNWLNAVEFVEDGKTGYITPFNDDQEFIKKVLFLVKNPSEIYKMKKNVIEIRDKYSAENAWEILRKSLDE